MRRSPADSAPHALGRGRSSFPIIPPSYALGKHGNPTRSTSGASRRTCRNCPSPARDLRWPRPPRLVSYLKDLGITAVELLPIHAKLRRTLPHQTRPPRTTGVLDAFSFFAPRTTPTRPPNRVPAAQAVVDEFPRQSLLLHQAGIEIILTTSSTTTRAGGDADPSLSWRSLDSGMYYRHTTSRPIQTIDVTGTGNT